MKAEFNIDDQEWIEAIAKKVADRLKPYLQKASADGNLLTVEDLQTYLHISRQRVYKAVQCNEVPYIKVKGILRFKKSEIDQWLEGNKIPACQHANLIKMPK